MKPLRPLRLALLAFAVPMALAAGCDLVPPDGEAGRGHGDALAAAPPCEVAGVALGGSHDDVATLLVTESGVALGRSRQAGLDPGIVAERYRGAGCALALAGRPTAVHVLLGADNQGRLYGFPRGSRAPDVVSTLPPERAGSWSEGVVVRIDTAEQVTKVLEAGRGIWSYGVSPSGGMFFASSCGPTGVFALDGAGRPPLMALPNTRWDSDGAIFTDDDTLWSLGHPSCDAALFGAGRCGDPLVRTTRDGDRAVADAAAGAPSGGARPVLARCGEHLCTTTPGAVVLFDRDGGTAARLDATAFGLRPGERLVLSSGNRDGVYALVRGEGGARLTYAPLPRGGR